VYALFSQLASLHVVFWPKFCMHCLFSPLCYMSFKFYSQWFNQSVNTRWKSQTMKFIVMKFFLFPYYLISFQVKILLPTLCSQTLSMYVLPSEWEMMWKLTVQRAKGSDWLGIKYAADLEGWWQLKLFTFWLHYTLYLTEEPILDASGYYRSRKGHDG
jgi:hypothetical protein